MIKMSNNYIRICNSLKVNRRDITFARASKNRFLWFSPTYRMELDILERNYYYSSIMDFTAKIRKEPTVKFLEYECKDRIKADLRMIKEKCPNAEVIDEIDE